MKQLQAKAFINQYGDGTTRVADLYDGDNLLQSALVAAFPGFEYPDFSHKTMDEIRAQLSRQKDEADTFEPSYSKWRHGGWYVDNVRYPSGAIGCVSNNYVDKKWRIVCDPRRNDLNEEGDFTFATRDAAARAEFLLAQMEKETAEPVAG